MSDPSHGGEVISAAIRASRPLAITAYLMAGYPTMEVFAGQLLDVSRAADVVEIGVPFTDPLADGLTIQRAADHALAGGVSLLRILDLLDEIHGDLAAPTLLMGYYNPFLAFGLDEVVLRISNAGVSGVIVPDLIPEESGRFGASLDQARLAMVRLVTPITPATRRREVVRSSQGFVYAVTVTGITGGDVSVPEALAAYLDAVRIEADVPVMAGFGVRRASQVAALAPHVDGVVVGTALLDRIDSGGDPAELIEELRA